MYGINILYVEHEREYQEAIKYYLESNGMNVHIASNPGEIIKYMNIAIDLVLTDVFWPDPETGKDYPRIEEIIMTIRAVNSVVPIVVLSGVESTCREALKYEPEIYDIWSKDAGYPDFFVYRVKNVIERRQNKLGEYILLQAVQNLCQENPDAWEADKIMAFIKKYQLLPGLGDMLNKIKELFKDLSYATDFTSTYIDDTFRTFVEVEPLDLARKPDAWGHLRHSLSVYLAGYVIINSRYSVLRHDDIINALKLSDWYDVNKAWFLACAFHDTKIFEEHVPEILEKCANITSHKLKTSQKVVNIDKFKKCKMIYAPDDYEMVKQLLSKMDRIGLYDVLKEYMQADVKTHVDHGILAAIDLFKNIGEYKGNVLILENSAYSILLHNCRDKELKIDHESDFLAQLLRFIDCFQAWGRENNYESLFDMEYFQKVVLRKFDLVKDNDCNQMRLSMKVDYLPFRFVSPQDSTIEIKEEKLKNVVRGHYDTLSRMGSCFHRDAEKKYWHNILLDFTFCISGRVIDI